jgi:hypothetical protein
MPNDAGPHEAGAHVCAAKNLAVPRSGRLRPLARMVLRHVQVRNAFLVGTVTLVTRLGHMVRLREDLDRTAAYCRSLGMTG